MGFINTDKPSIKSSYDVYFKFSKELSIRVCKLGPNLVCDFFSTNSYIVPNGLKFSLGVGS